MTKLSLLTFIIACMLLADFAYAEKACRKIFTEQDSSAMETIDKNIHDLVKMRLKLDDEKAEGKDTAALTALESDYRKKESALLDFVNASQIMPRHELTEKIRSQIAQLQKEKSVAGEKDKETKDDQRRRQEALIGIRDGTRIYSHRIEPGTFEKGKVGASVPTTINSPFDMMELPTTQFLWKVIADLAAQKLPGKYNINPDPSHFKNPVHPVESITYVEIQNWLQALNELSAMGEPRLKEILPEHVNGDVYRLPTSAEWEFVIRARGTLNDHFYFGNEWNQVTEHAWTAFDSKNSTHPVALKKPLEFEGKFFWDMSGNVREFVQDRWTAVNGQVDQNLALTRGGSFEDGPTEMLSGHKGILHIKVAQTTTGFRLARTVK